MRLRHSSMIGTIGHAIFELLSGSDKYQLATRRGTAHWQHAPFGQSKRTTAQDKRWNAKRQARKRARRLGHG